MAATKQLTSLILISFTLAACTTSHRMYDKVPPPQPGASNNPPPANPPPPVAGPEGAPPPPPVDGTPVPPPSDQKPFTTARASFGVWIDGAGFDAITALGFLQELEKAGYKPVKVVGSGFGCWVALSWALENKGTRAEWQTFKWKDFSTLEEQGLLGKLRGSAARQENTEAEVRRLLSVKNFSGFQLPTDCPLAEKSPPYRMQSGRSLDPAELLWHEMQIPTLAPEADALRGAYLSGVVGGTPLPEELEYFSGDVYSRDADHHFAGWLVLRTRTALDRGGSSEWNQILVNRAKTPVAPSGVTPSGISWLVVSLADAPQRPVAEIKKPENRRRWLLEGRKRAQALLKRDEIKNFLGGAAPR